MTKAAFKQYITATKADICTVAQATVQPLSGRAVTGLTSVAAISAVMMNMSVVFAATPLFSRLSSALESLLADAQDLVVTVATFALVICIIGIFIASIFGPKATATMTTALKMVIGFFIFWQLIPVILSTLTQVFGTGETTTP